MEFLSAPLTYIVIIANIILSFTGFKNVSFIEKALFKTDKILKKNQYGRLVSSGFIHGDWGHLFFNMFTLYSFGTSLEMMYGSLFFGGVYFFSLIGGNLLSLYLHRNQPEFASLGASGAVNGILFSSILVFPEMEVMMFLVPVGIPGWLFAILYTVYSMYALKSQTDNVGHDAHLGGAIVGTLVTVAFFPNLATEKWMILSAILIPGIVFIYILSQHPEIMGFEKGIIAKKRKPEILDHQGQIKAEKAAEFKRIFEKIESSGKESLNDYEKRFFEMNK
ncbi:MAG: rhomboid family intramembrane serine protease [Opitutaceae bacterium]|nr:rhomboid family intramembrane serine protease [Cytophagales bacterium]